MHGYLLSILGAVFPLMILAQSGCDLRLVGRIVDEHDGSGLDLAEVRIEELGRTVSADFGGNFLIEGLCAGTYTLRAAHLGCEPVEMRITIPTEKPLRVLMEHHAEELRDVEVARSRPDENVGQAHRSIERDELRADGDLVQALSRIPGVTSLSSGPTIAKPMIHGLGGNRVLILNQGVRQEDQQWGTEHAPNLDPFSSDRVTVVKGAASVQYGSDAIGGVVITEPVELPRGAGTSGEAATFGSWNGRGGGGNALLQGGVKGLRGIGWRVQGSGRYLGDSDAARYVLSNTGVREWGASGALGYRDHRWNAAVYYSRFDRGTGILRAAHIGNLTDLQNAISSGTPWYVGERTYVVDAPRQKVTHHLVKVDAGYAISERDRVVITYGYQADDRQEYDIRRAGRSGVAALDLSLRTHTADAVLKHWIGKHVHGKAGVSGIHQENLNIPGTGIRPLIPNYRKQSGGVFVVEHVPLSSRVEVEAGARFERTLIDVATYDADGLLITPWHHFTNHAITAGVAWAIRDSTHLRFNVGTAYRPPHVSELYSEGLHHGAAAIEEGDTALGSERATKATVDVETSSRNGRLKLEATLHASRINGFIYLRPEGLRLTIRGAFPVFMYVSTDAIIHGADLGLRYHLRGPWHWRLRASIVRGRDMGRDAWLFQMPADRAENALVFQHKGRGPWKRLECAVTSLLVLEQDRVPLGLDFAAPPPAYHLIGLSASVSHQRAKGEWRLGISAYNLLNSAYRDYLDRFRYFADARGTDITIQLRYSFGKPQG